MRVEPTELKLGKTIELFEAAFESYRILTSPGDKNTDTFHKDWTHLEKRWKVNNWLWHRKHGGSLFVFFCRMATGKLNENTSQ